ncbi:MAG: LytR/AlgR family response regulator transcription factor [Wujia sp.]
MKMQVVICDDNPNDIQLMEKEVHRVLDPLGCEHEIAVYSNANLLSKELEQLQCADILLLDIDMPGMNGIQLAAQLEQQDGIVNIIFVTNRNDLVFEAIHCRPFRFVRKEFLREELDEALTAVLKKIKEETLLYEFGSGQDMMKLRIRDIVFIESSGHYISIHMKDGSAKKIRGKISDYEMRLGQLGFVRIHIGYIVNLREIYSISNKSVILDSGETLPISRKQLEQVRLQHASYVRRYVRGIY